jgi:hypothetical protein
MAVFAGAVFLVVIVMTGIGYLVIPERRERVFAPSSS